MPPRQLTKDAVEVETAITPAAVAVDEEATAIVEAAGGVTLLAIIVVIKVIFLVNTSYQEVESTG